jgi:hypothetical protein
MLPALDLTPKAFTLVLRLVAVPFFKVMKHVGGVNDAHGLWLPLLSFGSACLNCLH